MKRAFTLVELVVVLVLLSFGLMTLLLLLRNASVNNAKAHFVTVAGGLAEGKVEEIKGDRITQGFDYVKNSNYPAEDSISGFNNYQREVNIYYVDLPDLNSQVGGPTGYKRVEVTVSSNTEIETEVSLVTLVSDY